MGRDPGCSGLSDEIPATFPTRLRKQGQRVEAAIWAAMIGWCRWLSEMGRQREGKDGGGGRLRLGYFRWKAGWAKRSREIGRRQRCGRGGAMVEGRCGGSDSGRWLAGEQVRERES